MEILEIIIFIVGILFSMSWMYGIRTNIKRGDGVAKGTVNITMLFIISLILVSILKISSFHLFWMFPVSMFFGFLSQTLFPFSLLSIPSNIITIISCLGLNESEVARNTAAVDRGNELVHIEGLTIEEAKKRLKEEGFIN